MTINSLLSTWRKIQQSNKYFYFFLLLLLLVVQATAFGNASNTTYLINPKEAFSTKKLNTNSKIANRENRLMNCTGTATVASNSGVDGAANAAGASDDSYAELHENNDVIVLDLGTALAAPTTITVYFRRSSNGTPIWTIGSSSTTAGFSGVAESPADLSSVSNGTASTFTITVPAGHQYVEIETNGFDADLDAFEFTCPTSSGGTGSSGGTSSTIACNASSGEIAGLVWLDVDFDGINDAAETRGFENVTVTAYDASGAVVGSALTLADGSYSIASLTDNVTYRVEFSNLG